MKKILVSMLAAAFLVTMTVGCGDSGTKDKPVVKDTVKDKVTTDKKDKDK